MLLFCWGQNEMGWGLLADSWWPRAWRWHTACVDGCLHGQLPMAAAKQRLLLASLLAPDSSSSNAAGPLGGEGFSLARDKENSEICFFQPQVMSYSNTQLCAAPALTVCPRLLGDSPGEVDARADREEVNACPALTLPALMSTGQGRVFS